MPGVHDLLFFKTMQKCKEIWKKYKQYILYLFFGGVTTLVSWASFYVCARLLYIPTVPSNVISWILAVAAAYVTNRKWVFESTATGFRRVIKEIISFTVSRLLSLGVETLLLWITVDICGWNDMLMKVIISIAVIIINYIFSKFLVFKPGEETGRKETGGK